MEFHQVMALISMASSVQEASESGLTETWITSNLASLDVVGRHETMWPGDAKDHKNTLLPGRYCAHQGASKHRARTKEVGVVEARDSSSSPPQVQPLPHDLLQVSSEVSCPRCWRGSPSLAQRACSCRSDRLSREGGKQALKNGKT